MADLKLCPLCDSPAEYDNDTGPNDDGYSESVTCKNFKGWCGIRLECRDPEVRWNNLPRQKTYT